MYILRLYAIETHNFIAITEKMSLRSCPTFPKTDFSPGSLWVLGTPSPSDSSTGGPRRGGAARPGQERPATLPGCDYQLLWASGRSSQFCIPLCYMASPKGKRDTQEGTAMPMQTAHVHLIRYPLTPDACPWGSADHAAQAHPGSWPLGRWEGMWADPAQT